MREELKRELNIRKAQLEEELLAINKLLGLPTVNQGSVAVQTRIEIPSPVDSQVMSKGNDPWSDYWLKVAKSLDGEYKAKDVADIGVKGNPDFDEKTVRSSAKHWLSKHAKSGKINARRGASLKEGNTYWN